eukprot:IDg3549t1
MAVKCCFLNLKIRRESGTRDDAIACATTAVSSAMRMTIVFFIFVYYDELVKEKDRGCWLSDGYSSNLILRIATVYDLKKRMEADCAKFSVAQIRLYLNAQHMDIDIYFSVISEMMCCVDMTAYL